MSKMSDLHNEERSMTYTRRQVVEVRDGERAVVIGNHPSEPDWCVVHFAHGGGLSIHASNMRPSNLPDHKGALPTYRSTQS